MTQGVELESTAWYVQLDGLRAIAVFSVFVTHWFPLSWICPGRLGVNLFFVISGFLISGILLRAKDSIEQGEQGVTRAAGHFFARRALRLLPLVYAVLLVTAVLDFPAVRETLIWHLFYAGNVFFALRGHWYHDTTHLWSLAVEEQFYLVWPWVILLVPRRFLLKTMIAVVASAPLFRLACYGIGLPSVSIRVLTPSSLDMFGIGSLLALLVHRDGLRHVAKTKIVSFLWMAGLPLLLLSTAADHGRLPILFDVGQALGSAFVFGWLVIRASLGFDGIVGYCLRFPPLVYAGKISYGLYVIHKFVPGGIIRLTGGEVWAETPSLLMLTSLVVTCALASLSWHLFEKPINGLKRFFPYS